MNTLEECCGDVELPFLVELTKNIILVDLQTQVQTPIDPESLAYDAEGFIWDEGEIVLDLTFKDQKGFARGRVYLKPSINELLDLCFVVDSKFIEYLSAPGSS